MNITESIELFLEHRRQKNYAKSTMNMDRRCLYDFRRFIKDEGISDTHQIRAQNIEDYQKYWKDYKNHKGQEDIIEVQNRYLATVKLLFRYLKKEGYVGNDLTEGIEYRKTPVRLPKPALTNREVKKFLRKVDAGDKYGYRNRTIFEVFYSTGIRRNELINIQLKDVDYENGFIRVLGKGNKERVVPIGKTACQHLENYISGIRSEIMRKKESKYLFLTYKGEPFTNSGLSSLVERYARTCGLEKKVTTHTFRRSCATGMIRNNANVMHVKTMLGHESIQTTSRYVDLTIHDLKKAHEKTHPRERE